MIRSLLLTFVLLSTITFAQVFPGLTVGYQSVSIKDNQSNSKNAGGTGFRLGGFVARPFTKGKFGIRVEAAYSFVAVDDNRYDSKFNMHYIYVLVSFFYMPHSQVQLFVGPQINVLLNKQNVNGIVSRVGDRFESIEYGIHGSFEIQASYHWSFAFRYYQGISFNSDHNFLNSIQVCLNYYMGKQAKK